MLTSFGLDKVFQKRCIDILLPTSGDCLSKVGLPLCCDHGSVRWLRARKWRGGSARRHICANDKPFSESRGNTTALLFSSVTIVQQKESPCVDTDFVQCSCYNYCGLTPRPGKYFLMQAVIVLSWILCWSRTFSSSNPGILSMNLKEF